MSNHIEAIGQAVVDLVRRYPSPPLGVGSVGWGATIREVGEAAWAAGVEALIAHEPCEGVGGRWHYHRRVNPMTGEHLGDEPEFEECPGPHTVIHRGDGTELHADRRRLRWRCDDGAGRSTERPGWVRERPCDFTGDGDHLPTCGWVAVVPVPEKWRIE